MIEPPLNASLAAMLAIGLLGAGHCVGMCGGIASALGFAARDGGSLHLIIAYNLGRITSYAVAGALVALVGQWGESYLALGPVLRIVSGVVLILMGCYLAGWWRVLVRLEKIGGALWKRIQPLSVKLLPVRSLPQALVLGMLWGWLPCGLVYTALAYAATSANTMEGALAMAAFGLGTAPAMVAGGLFAARVRTFLQSHAVRTIAAVIMIAFGVWTVAGVVMHGQHVATHSDHSAHQH